MPDWSPDGLHMVYAKPQSPPFFATPGVSSASLVTAALQRRGLGHARRRSCPSPGRTTTTRPTRPTGDWVALQPLAQQRRVLRQRRARPRRGHGARRRALGGALRRRRARPPLAAPRIPGALSWPKWAPVQHDYYGGKIMWLTFSSARAYGLRLAAGPARRSSGWWRSTRPRPPRARTRASPRSGCPSRTSAAATTSPSGPPRCLANRAARTSDCDTGETCRNGVCAPG